MLEWALSAAVLTALVIGLRYLLRGRVSPRLQYALWGLVLLRLLLPVSFGSAAVSVGNLAKEPKRVMSEVTLARTELSYDAAHAQVAGEYAQRGVDVAQLPPAEFYAVDREIRARMGDSLSLGDLLFGLWLGGMGVVGAALLVSNLRFALNLRRSRTRLEMPECRLPVYISDRTETPCLFGILRPAVYLTPAAAADDTMRRHAVAHELTHHRHGDHIWSILRGVCLALHWYDPLVWWAAVLSRRDCELACDAATVRRLGEAQRAEYGRTLIAMTCQKRPALLLGATTMTGGKNSLKERIVMIAKKPKTALCTLLAVLLISAVAAGCAFTGSKETGEPTASPAPSSPAGVVGELFPADEDAALTLYLADSGAYNTYAADPWYAERFRVLLEGYQWTPQEAPSTQPSDYWLTLASADGTKTMTFYADGGAGTVTYTDGTSHFCWKAATPEYSQSIVQEVRREYDSLDVDYERIAFSLDGDARAAAEHFVYNAFPAHLTSRAPGSRCAIVDYQVMSWDVREVSDGDDAVVGWFQYAFTPEAPDFRLYWAGDGPEEAGEYKGMFTHYMEFVLERQSDGLWHCVETGTGGCALPED